MNKYRDQRGSILRKGHTDEVSEEKLEEVMGMLQRVAKTTSATLNQVIGVYDAASRNRLTEVLLDSGDAFDNVMNDIKDWKLSGKALRLMLCGDTMADEVRVQVCTED